MCYPATSRPQLRPQGLQLRHVEERMHVLAFKGHAGPLRHQRLVPRTTHLWTSRVPTGTSPAASAHEHVGEIAEVPAGVECSSPNRTHSYMHGNRRQKQKTSPHKETRHRAIMVVTSVIKSRHGYHIDTAHVVHGTAPSPGHVQASCCTRWIDGDGR